MLTNAQCRNQKFISGVISPVSYMLSFFLFPSLSPASKVALQIQLRIVGALLAPPARRTIFAANRHVRFLSSKYTKMRLQPSPGCKRIFSCI